MLDRALASVHAQTYDDFDVWVVDDHSEDAAVEAVMEKWAAAFDARGIAYYPAKLPFNSGYQCVPKNAAIFHSSGDFIAYLDDDNTWDASHLKTMMRYMRPDVDMAYCGINYINETDNDALPRGRRDAQPWVPATIRQRNVADTSAIVHTRGAAAMVSQTSYNVWDESLRRFADWNLVARFADAGLRAAPVLGHYVNYYWHGDNLQLTRKPAGVYTRNMRDAAHV